MIDKLNNPGSNMLLCFSVLGFAIISYVLWKFVLSSPPPPTQQQSSLASSSTAASRGNNSRSTSSATTTTTSSTTASKNDTDDDAYTFGKSRHPPHLVPPNNTTKQQDLSGYLLQGIVPFRSTYASGYETRLQHQQQQQQQQQSSKDAKENDIIVTNRKERARIFARMFSPTLTTTQQKATKPPNRGANIVITIHYTDVQCNKLHKILYLLGTYYNLFLLIDGSEYVELHQINRDEKVLREFINKLRSELLNNGSKSSSANDEKEGGCDGEECYKLNEQIIPKHRIVFTSTSKGRVAFVRQLHGTELVVDYDEGNVTKELERFGFRVLVYPREEKKEGDGEKRISQSALGKFLIP